MTTPIFVLLSLATCGVALADEPHGYGVESGEVTYHLVHKFHHVDGRTRSFRGRGMVTDGKAQVVIEVPVESFDSGNSNRDAHMKEVLEAARFPTLQVKVLCTDASLKAPSQKLVCKAQIDFHGTKQIVDAPVTLTTLADGRVRATTHFVISLDAFKIERPSLLFVKVNDDVGIDANLTFSPQAS